MDQQIWCKMCCTVSYVYCLILLHKIQFNCGYCTLLTHHIVWVTPAELPVYYLAQNAATRIPRSVIPIYIRILSQTQVRIFLMKSSFMCVRTGTISSSLWKERVYLKYTLIKTALLSSLVFLFSAVNKDWISHTTNWYSSYKTNKIPPERDNICSSQKPAITDGR